MKAKVLIIAVFLALLLLCLGCERRDSPKEEFDGYKPMDYKPGDLVPKLRYVVRVIVIDNCEYIVVGNGHAIIHKANCKNPVHTLK